MMKKLSCGLLALSMAFNGAPALVNNSANILGLGAIEVSAAQDQSTDLHYDGTALTLATGESATNLSSIKTLTITGNVTLEATITAIDKITEENDIDYSAITNLYLTGMKSTGNTLDAKFSNSGPTIDVLDLNLFSTVSEGALVSGQTVTTVILPAEVPTGKTLDSTALGYITPAICIGSVGSTTPATAATLRDYYLVADSGSDGDTWNGLALTPKASEATGTVTIVYDGVESNKFTEDAVVTFSGGDALTVNVKSGDADAIKFVPIGTTSVSVTDTSGTYKGTITALTNAVTTATLTAATTEDIIINFTDLGTDETYTGGKITTTDADVVKQSYGFTISGTSATITGVEYADPESAYSLEVTGAKKKVFYSCCGSDDWDNGSETYEDALAADWAFDTLAEAYASGADTVYTVTQATEIEYTGNLTVEEGKTSYDVTVTAGEPDVTYTAVEYIAPEEEYVAPDTDVEDEDDAEDTYTDAEINIDDIVCDNTIDEVVEATSPDLSSNSTLSSLFSRIEALITLNITGSGKITVPITGLKYGEKVQVFISYNGGSSWIPLSSSNFSTKGAMATMVNGVISNTVTSSGGTMNLEINVPSSAMIQIASVNTVSSGSTSPGGGSYTSATYHDSGSVRVNGTYITELRNVLVGELVNLSKITTVNGQEVTGWYYDSAMTKEITNPSQFVITSSVIGDGLYARTSGTTVVPDSYVDGSTNAGTGATTAPETTYQPSVVPSTVANLLGKLF